MYKELNNNQHGAVAMITVIFIAILLTIITTSFIRLSINEQRGATDDDLTTRAFYAAESGVQDAIRAIQAETVDPANAETCTPNDGPAAGELSNAAGLNTSYTCQLIDLTPAEYQAYMNESDSSFFKLKSADSTTPADSFKIQWHLYGPQNESSDGLTATERSNNDLPRAGTVADPLALDQYWNDTPAMLRLQVIEVDPDFDSDSNDITREDIRNHVAFLNPRGSGETSSIALAGLDVAASPGPLGVECAYDGGSPDPGEYFCHLTVTTLDVDNEYYIKVNSLYAPTHLKVEGLVFATGTAVNLKDAQAVIDVTGKATDVYRRVEERVDITQNILWPPFGVIGAEAICKNFVVTNDVADFGSYNAGIYGSCTP